jgi:GntR family transcriptional regulator
MLKYEELAKTLEDEIARGTYHKGQRLPTTPELCQIYGVSNTTVKRAMDDLELKGIVARRRGSGVYVKETTSLASAVKGAGSTSGQMTGFSAEHADRGQTVTSEVHEFSVTHAPKDVAGHLGLEPDEFVYHICRVRSVDGVPRVVEYTWMPLELIPGLREGTLHKSIYGFIEDELGLKIGSAHRAVKAVMPTDEERRWLGIDDHSPLLEVRQVAYLANGIAFEFSTSRHTADYEFYSISTR